MSTTGIIIVSILGVAILAVIAFAIAKSVGARQSQSAKWGSRHVRSSANGGKPENAVGFASEGNMALFKDKSSRFSEPLDPQLEKLGISEEDWRMVQNKLRNRWRQMGNKDFKEAINELNEELFFKNGCVAVYAEYGVKGGQKAMTIYTQEVWDSLPK